MGNAFRFLFNLYPGEWKKASLFIVLGLFWSMGGYGTFTLSEGLFLEHVGASGLPTAYFAIASSMCALSGILIFALGRLSIRYLLFSLIAFWIAANFTILTLLPCDAPAFWYVFKVIGWIGPLSTYIVYWAFIDLYFDLQDAKRFFCLFNAITFLGDSMGGAMTSFLLAPLGIAGLLTLFISLMACALPILLLISKRITPLAEGHAMSGEASSKLSFGTLFKTIIRSRFTLYLLLFYFAMQVLAIVTEYNYMGAFERAFAGESDHALTEFIGTCSMWISLSNMLFGMIFYSRLVKKMGINNIIMVAPLFFLAVFGVWNVREILPIAIFGMIAREGMIYTFDDNNLNLLISGVPTKVKNQVRISVESFFEPIGMFSGGLLLLAFNERAHLLGLILAGAAFSIVLLLRSTYARAIFRNLVASSLRFEKKAVDWIAQFSKKERRSTEFLLLSKLKTAREKEQLLAFEYLLKIEEQRVLPHLLNHLGKLSLPGKLDAIELLSASSWATEPLVLERLESARRVFPHAAVRSAIHAYFARHGLIRPEKVMHDLESAHLGLRSAAILTLKTTPHAAQFPSFMALASDKLNLLLASKIDKEICSGLRILGHSGEEAETLITHLSHPSRAIQKEAALALSRFASRPAPLITHLANTRDLTIRRHLLSALEKCADHTSVRPLILASRHFQPAERKHVEKIILTIDHPLADALLQITCDATLPNTCRLLAGKILGKLKRKTLQTHLDKLIRSEIERAYFYFYHANTIQEHRPEHDLHILTDALDTGYHSTLDFIIQLLGAAGSIEESDVLSHTLRSPVRKIRAQAIESLEKTCTPTLFTLLEPLISDAPPESRIHHYLRNGGIPHTLAQLLDSLHHSPSLGDQLISIAMKAKLKTPDWRLALHKKLKTGEPIFHHFATDLMETPA